jgi:hypothetical protein
MASSELLEIKMRMVGAKTVAEEARLAGKGIERVGKGSTLQGIASGKAAKKTSLLGRAYGGLKSSAKLAFGAIAVGGVFALRSAITATTSLAKTTSALSRNLGITTQEASRWGAVAEARGIDTKAMQTSFAILSSKFVEAGRKGGTALTLFHQLGITQKELTAHAGKFNWALLRSAKALGEEKGGTVRMTAAKALLGKGYQSILPLFSEGTKGLKEQLHWADKYGVTLSGKTTNQVMEFVNAQRQSKVALLGLKISLATALMPALKAGEGQLQEFIATLNSNKLSGSEKIVKIGKQFEGIEDTLIGVITAALPKVAEQGGMLGVKLAGAVVKGFLHANTFGKLVIGTWVFKFFGGFSALSKLGGKMARALGRKFLETLAPYFAAEAGVEGIGSALASQMGGLKTLFRGKGKILGSAMGAVAGAALIAEIIFAFEESENIAGLSLFNTPKVSKTSIESEAAYLRSQLGYTKIGFDSGKRLHGINQHGERVTWVERGGHWRIKKDAEGGKSEGPKRRPQLHHERPIVIHNKIHLDGKLVAQNTLHHAELSAELT